MKAKWQTLCLHCSEQQVIGATYTYTHPRVMTPQPVIATSVYLLVLCESVCAALKYATPRLCNTELALRTSEAAAEVNREDSH